jgi:hypothetical protein
MSAFTNESAVRLKFQIADTVLAPSALIGDAIAEAHETILQALDPAVDTVHPPNALVIGETLLAGACLFRTLAGKCATNPMDIVVGGQRIARGSQFSALLSFANEANAKAWTTLEPYLQTGIASQPALLTDTVPVELD